MKITVQTQAHNNIHQYKQNATTANKIAKPHRDLFCAKRSEIVIPVRCQTNRC